MLTFGDRTIPKHIKDYGFFLTKVDDFNTATWTHLMITKDEALRLFK